MNLLTSVQNLKFDISKGFCAIRFHCTECFCAINTSEFIWFISENYCHKFPKYFGQKFKRNKMLLFSKLVLWALKWDRFPGGLCSALIQLRAILNFNNAKCYDVDFGKWWWWWCWRWRWKWLWWWQIYLLAFYLRAHLM